MIHPDPVVDSSVRGILTPFDTLRSVAAMLGMTRQTPELCALSAEDLLKVALALRASDFDVFPDALTSHEIEMALADDWSGLNDSLNSRFERGDL